MVPSGHEIDGFSLVSIRWVTELSANSMHSMTAWHVFRGQESPYSDTRTNVVRSGSTVRR